MTKKLKRDMVLAVTVLRIPLVLGFLAGAVVYALGFQRTWLLALNMVFLVASMATDGLDGYLARSLGVESELGAAADLLADRTFFLTTLPLLIFVAARNGNVAHAVVLVALTPAFLFRDHFVGYLRTAASRHGAELKAQWWGKARTFGAFIMVVVAYLYEELPAAHVPSELVYGLEAAVLGLTIASGIMYARFYKPYMQGSVGNADEVRPPL